MKWIASAQNAGLNLMKKPDCAWNLTDLYSVPQNGIKVMSTFACGGGSSMGYKLAGCEVIAANDIDPEMAWHYKKNLNPKIFYLCPIKELITGDIDQSLYDLDILDGSPPCSTFSIAGNREKDWGKNKNFREGQATQVLSDLFFDYLDLVERLKPKVAIAENVKGMILGNAKGYTKLIMDRFKDIGYRPQLFLVNSADCGVPQKRQRIFFVAIRDDIKKDKLKLFISNKKITAANACADIQDLTEAEKKDTSPTLTHTRHWYFTKPGQNYAAANKLRNGKPSSFNYFRIDGSTQSNTITGVEKNPAHWSVCRTLTFREWKRLGGFPDDYNAKTDKIGKYMVGMSVPPRMTEQVARAVIDQWLSPVASDKLSLTG